MIKNIRDFYESELKNKKGQIVKLNDFELDYTFVLIEGARAAVVHQLVLDEKARMYYGVHTNSTIIPKIREEVGEVILHNEIKAQGATLDLDNLKEEIKDMDDFEKAANEAMDKFKDEVKENTKKKEIKVHNDEYLLLPYDVEISEYQRVIDKIKDEGYSIYDEHVFVEIL